MQTLSLTNKLFANESLSRSCKFRAYQMGQKHDEMRLDRRKPRVTVASGTKVTNDLPADANTPLDQSIRGEECTVYSRALLSG